MLVLDGERNGLCEVETKNDKIRESGREGTFFPRWESGLLQDQKLVFFGQIANFVNNDC